jgi:hypothetical protein
VGGDGPVLSPNGAESSSPAGGETIRKPLRNEICKTVVAMSAKPHGS